MGAFPVDRDLLSSEIVHTTDRLGHNEMVFRPAVTELGEVDKILVVFCPPRVEIVMISRNQIDVTVFQRINSPFTVELRAGIDVESVLFPYFRLLGQHPKWSVGFRSVNYFQFTHDEVSSKEVFVFYDKCYRLRALVVRRTF